MTSFTPTDDSVWLATKGDNNRSETSGIYLDADTIKFWTPGDSPIEFLDSDSSAGGAYAGVKFGTVSAGTWHGSTISVSYGGTGKTTLTSGYALIGNGTNAISLRAITNNTSATAVTASTNLITANTLYYHKGNSNITTVGTISSGTWNGSTIGIAYGGTGMTSNPSMLVNLGSTSAASVFTASPRPGVTGTLAISNGGTGMTSNPSMLVNLGSTSAASVFAASPRPGITGTLGVANGGTGKTSWTTNRPIYASAATTLTYASSIYISDTLIRPTSAGGASLGAASYPWSAVHSTYFNATSDIRKKKDISTYEGDGDILSLPVYRFKYRDSTDNNERIGCMAQDLQLICPEIVHADEEGYLSIEESKIVYLLLEKMKDMQKEINALKGEDV